MDRETVTLFFALLATVAQAAVALAVLSWLVGRLAPSVARLRAGAVAQVAPQAFGLAAAVALVCTLGSLYLSEVAHFPPCKLCWYQRICMYPLVVILGLAAIRRDASARLTGIVLAATGGAISTWHLLIEAHPDWSSSSSCELSNPCSIKWVERFGYLTIPGMALSGFALILTILVVTRPAPEETS